MKVCARCGEEFARPLGYSARQWESRRYCSKACASTVTANAQWASGGRERGRVERVCGTCGAVFQTQRSTGQRFCCLACANRAPRRRPQGKGVRFSNGRWYITRPDGTEIARYRHMMEEHLGRRLTDAEVVHHINGNPADDRLENLRVLTRAEHMEIHRNEIKA